MNVNLAKMEQYTEFLTEKSREIVNLCTEMEQMLLAAVQCMDQQSGKNAATRMAQNIENVKNNVPISQDAAQRLGRSRTLINNAAHIFGG